MVFVLNIAVHTLQVKDLAVTIDSKEKLLDQLCAAQKEHERLREIYEQTLKECDAEVKKAQREKEAASIAIQKVQCLGVGCRASGLAEVNAGHRNKDVSMTVIPKVLPVNFGAGV